MNSSPSALVAGSEESKENGPPTQMVKTEEIQEPQKIFPFLSLDLSLLQRVGKFLPPKDVIELAHFSKDCLKSVSSQLNLELSLKNKILTEDDFLSRFGENGLYKNAQCLNLSGSYIDPALLRYLPKTIKALKLSGVHTDFFNKYGFADKSAMVIEIARVLGEALPNLKFLDISYNQLGAVEAQGITQHLAKLPSLQFLDISNNDLKAAGALHIARLSSLTTLDISRNGLGAAGALHIAKLSSLKSLDISGNILRDAGARHIAKLTSLNSLNFSINLQGVEGARHIAEHLIHLTFLAIDNLRQEEKQEIWARLPFFKV